MAIIKCKMCGGNLNVQEGMTVAECEYCGTKQTVPSADNEKKVTLFNRANRLRYNCEFDKAAGVYESIVADFPEEAEAYWGLVLCQYGIEYVDDPATGKKIPTCHRSSFDSIMDDPNFEQAQENADAVARKVYREEAKAIEELRKEIIEVSGKEEPYDIFICYKETNENGDRTLDSVLAQEIYDDLTERGYRVFFSRITLEDKLGQEYEPYIFAALNSAKIMLAVGTDYEYYNAVWVKNEWSRFLKLMTKDKAKHLIPCFKNLDAYDMPKEFAKLQAQDLGKVGAMQDLLRGIEKILGTKGVTQPVKETVVVQQPSGPNVESLLKRAFMFLEDGEWDNAVDYCNKVLDIQPENGEAYLGFLLADLRLKNETALALVEADFADNKNYEKVIRFTTPARAAVIEGYRNSVLANIEKEQEKRKKTERIAKAQKFICGGSSHTVGLRVDGTVVAAGSKEQCNVSDWENIVAISGSPYHTVGLKADGTVEAVGSNEKGQCNVFRWASIISIFATERHTVGLKADGTVIATKDIFLSDYISKWTDIIAISGSPYHIVGLKADGTVEAVGSNEEGQCNVFRWASIISIFATERHTVGLKADGTVVAVGRNKEGQCNVSDWEDIVAISGSRFHTVGLKADGTVVAVGRNEEGQCNVADWKNIVAIFVSIYNTVGLKADGTVVAVGRNEEGQCNVADWKNIVAISVSICKTVGLKADGTVVAVGRNKEGQCNVAGWKLFNNIDTIDVEREEARNRREQALKVARERKEKELKEAQDRWRKEQEEIEQAENERRRKRSERLAAERKAQLEQDKASLQSELASLKGLFSGKRRREIEARLIAIERMLKGL